MKYKFEFEIVEWPDGEEEVLIHLEEKIDIIQDFLMDDIDHHTDTEQELLGYNVGEKMIADLKSLIKEETEFLDWNGNVCALEAKKDMTEVSHFYKGEGVPDSCWIETSELIELIQIWMDAYKRFELEGSGWVEKRRKV